MVRRGVLEERRVLMRRFGTETLVMPRRAKELPRSAGAGPAKTPRDQALAARDASSRAFLRDFEDMAEEVRERDGGFGLARGGAASPRRAPRRALRKREGDIGLRLDARRGSTRLGEEAFRRDASGRQTFPRWPASRARPWPRRAARRCGS